MCAATWHAICQWSKLASVHTVIYLALLRCNTNQPNTLLLILNKNNSLGEVPHYKVYWI